MDKLIASTYEVIEKIGSGGGGDVYLARHLRLKTKVVLKADKRNITTRQELLRREVDILKELSHSYIPQVYDYFVEDDTVYTVMGYIDGESLDKPLERGEKFSQPQVIKWANQLLEALSYLHSPIHGNPPRGYVHSDIKPSNIMRTPYNDICLIDFNIALALGEENVVGCSAGYASPEHYGLDYTSFGSDTAIINDTETIKVTDEPAALAMSNAKTSMPVKKVVPDVRSDIYSVGATLYHLLSGKRPARDAMDVEPLSNKDFSQQIVDIISKAMNPNPDLRYQTADEMLKALSVSNLHKNDIRTRILKRNNWISCVLLSMMLLAGSAMAFLGLKRMQVVESWLKLSEYSQSSLADGDSISALYYALQALPTTKNVFTPAYIPEAQKALTDALGVYDLSDGFKKHKVVELPSNPLFMVIAPNGKTAACMYSGYVTIFNTETANNIITLPANKSALSEVEYLADYIIVYAGIDGITTYDFEKGVVLWSGKPCTAISLSQDRRRVAAIYKDESTAIIYDAVTGEVKKEVDFDGQYQRITVNDNYANPKDNLFEMNADGTLLGVSFADGTLRIYDLSTPSNDIELCNNMSVYTHFEGGFYGRYFAFSATGSSGSVFTVIDTVEKVRTGGFEADRYMGVEADENGIYVQTDNLLVKIHPVTGEQTPLVTTSEHLSHFATSDFYSLATSRDLIMFFGSDSNLITSFEEEETGDFVQLANDYALIGSRDSPEIKIMKCENYSQMEVFKYASSYDHDEARISADRQTVMLFSYRQFRVYEIDGEFVKEIDIPDADQVYDQQFSREKNESYLKVIYNDGRSHTYNARDGSFVSEEQIGKPDLSLYDEFQTDSLRIESPLHGRPTVYNKKSDKKVCELDEEGYLTYVTQAGEYIVAQYITSDDYYYGVLMNNRCETLATLPYLSDVVEDELYFDYPSGDIRKTRIYSIEELINMAHEVLAGGQ